MKFSTCALVLSMLVSWPGQPLAAQPSQLASHPASQRASDSLLAEAKSAEQVLSQRLHTVVARGRIRNTIYLRDLASPKVTLDADVQVYYDAPKFMLWMQYASHSPDDSRALWDRQTATDQDLAARVSAQILLFDGQTLTTVRRAGDGSCRGDIYFDFHRPNQLRKERWDDRSLFRSHAFCPWALGGHSVDYFSSCPCRNHTTCGLPWTLTR